MKAQFAKNTFVSFGAALALLTSVQSFAASQGTVGQTSTGSVNINVTKLNEARISGLSDITFGSTADTPAKTSIDACVYSTTGKYSVTASSQYGTGSQFRLSNSNQSSHVIYNVEWKDNNSSNSGNDLNHGQQSSGFQHANTTQSDCGGGRNARLFVQIEDWSFDQAPAGAYSDVLTLVVAPQ